MSNQQTQSHFISCVDKLTRLALANQENNGLNNKPGVNEFLGASEFPVKLRGEVIRTKVLNV